MKRPTSQRASDWWSVTQALAWIVGRNESVVREIEVAGERTLWALRHNRKIVPVAAGGKPPIPLIVAQSQLLQAARSGKIKLMGHKFAIERLAKVPVSEDFVMDDYEGMVCVGERGFDYGEWWGALSVRESECKSSWGPADSKSTVAVKASVRAPSAFLSEMGKKGAAARHAKHNEARAEILRIWATGKYATKRICAEEENEALKIAFETARNALKGAPDPNPWPAKLVK
jgi:hypothetical protein